MMDFNLLTDPFIPCVHEDGRAGELGILGVLQHARRIREIHHSSPLTTMAMHKLLLAFLHRVHNGPTDEAHWQRLWEGGWDLQKIDSYAAYWTDRFNLYD